MSSRRKPTDPPERYEGVAEFYTSEILPHWRLKITFGDGAGGGLSAAGFASFLERNAGKRIRLEVLE